MVAPGEAPIELVSMQHALQCEHLMGLKVGVGLGQGPQEVRGKREMDFSNKGRKRTQE